LLYSVVFHSILKAEQCMYDRLFFISGNINHTNLPSQCLFFKKKKILPGMYIF